MMLLWKLFGFRAEPSEGDPIPVWALAVVWVRVCGVTVVVYFCFSYSSVGPRVKWNFITENLFERAFTLCFINLGLSHNCGGWHIDPHFLVSRT